MTKLSNKQPAWGQSNVAASAEGVDRMKFCYSDESGTGNEPIAVMVGIIVDAQRMHITKQDWSELLRDLSQMAGRDVSEIHTRNFYAGNGIWREVDGPTRAKISTHVFQWLVDRKHHVVYTSVSRKSYFDNFKLQFIPDELNTLWRFLGFHLILAVQKLCQQQPKNKGNTILIFDNEEREQMRFTDVILRPPAWSGEYYGKKPKQKPLDQIVDVPYFGDSQDVGLIQLADFVAFFLRRYAEIKEGLVPPKYADEQQRIDAWIDLMKQRSVPSSNMYPKVGRSKSEALFFDNAPESIRSL